MEVETSTANQPLQLGLQRSTQRGTRCIMLPNLHAFLPALRIVHSSLHDLRHVFSLPHRWSLIQKRHMNSLRAMCFDGAHRTEQGVFQVAGPPVQQFDLVLPTVPCGQQTGRCERVTVAMSASGPAVECHCRSTVLWWMVPVCMCPVVHCDDPPSNYRSVRLQGPWNGITDGTSLQFPSHAPPYPYEVPVPFLRPCVRETKDRHRRQWQKLLRNRCCKSGSARRCAWPYISGFRPRTLYHGEQHVFLQCSMHTMQCTRPWPSDFRNHLQLRSLKFLYRYANGFRQGKSVSLGFSPVPCVTR